MDRKYIILSNEKFEYCERRKGCYDLKKQIVLPLDETPLNFLDLGNWENVK